MDEFEKALYELMRKHAIWVHEDTFMFSHENGETRSIKEIENNQHVK